MRYIQYIQPVVTNTDEELAVDQLATRRLETGAHSHPQWLRLCYIERQLLWERKLTTTMLMETFGISRPQAQKDIKLYKSMAPKNVRPYTLELPYHQPTEDFMPVLLSEADLHWEAIEEYAPPKADHTTEMPMLTRRHNLLVLAMLLSAIEHNRSLEAVIATMNSPLGRTRRFTPRGITYVNNRYHVRAFCWHRLSYVDFLIGRFQTTPTIVKPATTIREWGNNAPAFDRLKGIPPEHDTDWNSVVKIELKANPALSADQQAMIADDYGLTVNGAALCYELRKPLIGYFLVDNRIPANEQEFKLARKLPNAWPVIAECKSSGLPAHLLGFTD